MMLDDVIDANDYRETKSQYQPVIDKLVRQQAEVALMDSSCKLYADFGFSILKNLGKYYDSLDLEGKQQFIGLIFPEKFVFENNQFRTKHLRPAVLLICRKIKGFGGDKKGLAIRFDGQSTNVTPIGLFDIISKYHILSFFIPLHKKLSEFEIIMYYNMLYSGITIPTPLPTPLFLYHFRRCLINFGDIFSRLNAFQIFGLNNDIRVLKSI